MLKPFEIQHQILRHPKLVHSLLPHFTLIKKKIPIALEGETHMVRTLLRNTLPKIQGRLFVQVKYNPEELWLGFEEGSDATFFTLTDDEKDF